MYQESSRVAILALGTAVPQYCIEQEALSHWMVDAVGASPALGRWLRRLYAGSGIDMRYYCLPDPLEPPSHSRFAPGRPLSDIPNTAERMAIYEREAVIVGAAAARQALNDYCERFASDPQHIADSITHLITVSCTGFFAPGLDLMIARQLNLRPTVERTLVGFMGCAAAFNGLRLANQIVRGQPSARVLVVCVELCSLHIQPGQERENLISASLFADGAAACLVGAPESGQGDLFELSGFHTSVHPDTETDMIWRIGNHGFTLRLSPRIPDYLAQTAPQALRKLVGDHAMRFWAIHPGGRGIVDRLAEIFQLAPADVAATRNVLRRYGNMSSPTILFVLHAHRQQLRLAHAGTRTAGVAMAFGPGLVIEMAQLVYVPDRVTVIDNREAVAEGAPVEQLA